MPQLQIRIQFNHHHSNNEYLQSFYRQPHEYVRKSFPVINASEPSSLNFLRSDGYDLLHPSPSIWPICSKKTIFHTSIFCINYKRDSLIKGYHTQLHQFLLSTYYWLKKNRSNQHEGLNNYDFYLDIYSSQILSLPKATGRFFAKKSS